mmetsp:Transcript_62580/g.147173  ORF Transcript_62580/g.147173 Transcript_62580/m.147173 type:complete len:177 (-) Transcript_62580:274-804(-)
MHPPRPPRAPSPTPLFPPAHLFLSHPYLRRTPVCLVASHIPMCATPLLRRCDACSEVTLRRVLGAGLTTSLAMSLGCLAGLCGLCGQLAAADKLITPLPFSQDTDNSFLGWTGFQVEQERAQEFRRRIEALFPVPLPENTLHTAFRRAGLVPDKWTSGWLGMSPFRFSLQTRQHYR